ncbi:MAG: AAA family ATPase, partial [Candidatus Helarchaeota archaeon]
MNDKKKYSQFMEILHNYIDSDDYVAAFKLLSEARNFVMATVLSQKSYHKLESFFEKSLTAKLKTLGFVDVSGKILSTTFWAMMSSGNLALKGPPGIGKSFFSKVILPNLWMYKGKLPHVLTIQPDRNMDIASLVADRGIKKGDTIVEEGQIADAVNLANKGQNVILVLEEINQWPPKVLKDLNDFLEERKLERKIAGKFIKLECP